MSKNVMISFLGENKPNLISDVTNYLTEQGGEFSGVTFATLGRVCELTMVYQVSKNEDVSSLNEGLSSLKSVKNGEFTVKELAEKVMAVTGIEAKLVYKELPKDDPVKRRPNISVAKELFDWEPQIPLEEGLKKAVPYFKSFV